jgi:hypothetical protein
LALVIVTALAFFSLISLTTPLRPFKIIMPVFLTEVLWLKDFWNIFFEFRIYPILGAVAFFISFLWLRKGKAGLYKMQLPFFLGVGFSSYSFFRFCLFLTFKEDPAWADWWEETFEFIMIISVLLLLMVFKSQLNLKTPWPFHKSRNIKQET